MKTILVTGATGSIGKATAQALAQRGNMHLIIAGRNAGKLAAVKALLKSSNVKVVTLEVDLSDAASIDKSVEKVKAAYPTLDGLVNIASVYKSDKTLTRQGLETMFATNHLGPFALTQGLLPLLRSTPGSKIVTVTAPSTTKLDFDNLNGEKKFSALNAFGGSKMMNLLMAFRLAKEVGPGHASMAFHPGLVKSDLLAEAPAILRGLFRLISAKPEKAAASIAALMLEGDAGPQNGKFFTKGGKELKPAPYALDEAVQEKLWEVSEVILRR